MTRPVLPQILACALLAGCATGGAHNAMNASLAIPAVEGAGPALPASVSLHVPDEAQAYEHICPIPMGAWRFSWGRHLEGAATQALGTAFTQVSLSASPQIPGFDYAVTIGFNPLESRTVIKLSKTTANLTLNVALHSAGKLVWEKSFSGSAQIGASVTRMPELGKAMSEALAKATAEIRATAEADMPARLEKAKTLASRAAAAEKRGDAATALELYAAAYHAAAGPEKDAAFTAMGKALERLGMPDLPPDARRAKVQAEDAVQEKRFDAAARLYTQALSLAPWWADGYFNRALIQAELSLYNAAIVEMKRYLQLAPNAPDAQTAQDKIYSWEAKAL